MKHRNNPFRLKLDLQTFAETVDLKTVLGDELYKQVTDKLGDKHKVAIVSDGNWIPKETFNSVNEAKKKAEDDLKERDKQLEELKKNAGDSAAMKEQITKLQGDNKVAADKYAADMKELRISTALKLALAGDAHDPDLVAGLLDKTKIELDDAGNVKMGLDEQVKALRESKAFLFVPQDGNKGPQFKGAKPPEGNGNKGGGGGQVNPWKKETFNLTEQGRILRDNPDVAKQLQDAAK